MMFSKHDWEFQGVGSLFQGGSNGDNGDYGTLMDPGTDYCVECLDSPWDGMVGLEVWRHNHLRYEHMSIF
jgi:hypothetical protein